MEIVSASTNDLGDIQSLLKASRLPFADLTERHMLDFIVAKDGTRLIGAVGIERYGEHALLRSLVVETDARRRGVAEKLLDRVESTARDRGTRSLILLTTTASDFFAKRGYARIERATVPSSVQASSEFASICPTSATCMQKLLARKRVAFICIENSNRSQIAQAFARRYPDIDAYSAGSKPSGRVNPRAVEMMSEIGISLADHYSKSLDKLSGEFDAVVTMGCGDACPWIPAKQRIEWSIRDPKELDDTGFRAVRDDIARHVDALVAKLQRA